MALVSKRKHRHRESEYDLASRKDSIKLSEYLSIKKLVNSSDGEDSTEKKYRQDRLDDRIFESNEVSIL